MINYVVLNETVVSYTVSYGVELDFPPENYILLEENQIVNIGDIYKNGKFIAPESVIRPEIVITDISITEDSFAGFPRVNAEKTEVTVPVGATLQFVIAVKVMGQTYAAFNDDFRMPIQKESGIDSRLVLVDFINGVATVQIAMTSSGRWNITPELVNGLLPPEMQMDFKGMSVFVVEV